MKERDALRAEPQRALGNGEALLVASIARARIRSRATREDSHVARPETVLEDGKVRHQRTAIEAMSESDTGAPWIGAGASARANHASKK